jgi:hypothetical protein
MGIWPSAQAALPSFSFSNGEEQNIGESLALYVDSVLVPNLVSALHSSCEYSFLAQVSCFACKAPMDVDGNQWLGN